MTENRIARGYDRLARWYDLLAGVVFGRALRRAQTCYLHLIEANADVLVVGGGSGWFLEELLRHTQPRRVVYLELSPQMLALAKKRIVKNLPQALDRVEFVEGSAEDMTAEAQFDWVVTHCLLDMFPEAELAALIGRLGGFIRPGGGWYFSDFAQPTRRPMRWIASALLWIMYRFFRFTCHIHASRLPDFGPAFVRHSFGAVQQKQFYGGMIEAWIMRRFITKRPGRNSQLAA